MPWTELLVLVFLILLNAFLVAAELAIVSSRPARLHKFVGDGRSGAIAAAALNADPGRFLPSVQIGITVVAIISGAYGELTLAPELAEAFSTVGCFGSWSDWVASFIVVATISYFSLVIGELVPKRLALANREVIACSVAPALAVWAVVSSPISSMLRVSTDAVLRLAGPMKAEPEVTEEEVKSMIAEGTEAGVFEKGEQEIIERVLSVADRSVRAIMVPRRDIIWLDVNDSEDAVFKDIFTSGHSRFPVCRDDVDETLGVIHAKTLLEQCRNGGKINLEAAIKAPLYVHESTNVLKLLDMFKVTLVHMAIVLDEHGTVQGIVTPADILSGIAGELPEVEADIGTAATQREDGSWLLDAQMPVYEVERVLDVKGMSVDDAEYTTLAGFVLSQLGHIPAVGEKFSWRSWVFEVVDLDGRRIDKVLAFRSM